jgi:hypothetical protein
MSGGMIATDKVSPQIEITPEMIEAGTKAFLACVFEEELSPQTTGLGPGLKAAFSAMLQRSNEAAP